MSEKREKEKIKLRDRMKNAWRNFSWKNPLHRWKFIFFALLFIVVGYFAFDTSLQATSTRAFCAGCHIMEPENVTHDLTVHAEFKCIDCHIEPGKMEYYKAKTIGAAPKAWYVTLGDLRNPIYMAKAPVSNAVCEKCHSENRDVTPRGDLIVNHQGHISEDILCVSCHSGVAHGKIVERGLNYHEDLDYWDMENGEHLISDASIRTNMGTCIDCHIRYNDGERPWEDKYFSLSYPPNYESQSFGLYETFEIMRNQEENLQEGQISHACSTCHTEWDIPENHNRKDFVNNHGDDAVEDFASCINCHDQAKWQKDLEQEYMEKILDPSRPNLEHYTPDINVVQSLSKENKFCFSCHEERPENHLTSDIWLTEHAVAVDNQHDVNRCLVCHDFDEAEEISEENLRDLNIQAPTDVTCGYCHRTGLAVE